MELMPGYKQTEVGAVPEDWDVVLLDSVARRASGHTPDKTHPEYWGGDIKWVSLADSQRLDNLYISETAATITPEGIANSSANLLPAGSCIVSRDAGVGKSAILAEPMAVSQHFMAWNCGPRLSNHYLYFLLQAMKPELERIAIGNTIKTIGLPYFKALRIQLPSIEEQNSIASALTDIDQFIRRLERSIAKKQGIKQAARQELLTGKRRLPGFEGEWEAKTLADLEKMKLVKLSRGHVISKKDISNKPGVFPIYSSSIHNDGLFGSYGGFMFDEELITWSVDGGGNFFYRRKHKFSVTNVCGFMRINSSQINCRFLAAELQLLHGRKNFDYLSKAHPSVIRKEYELLLPPLPEQVAIAELLTDMDDELADLEQRREKTRHLNQGMMQELLTGRTRLV